MGLARFLRSRRERLVPSAIGLPVRLPRRTPGLRREEVAVLAHISTEHYTRLEQARGAMPSRQVLAEVGRALRLSDDERAHLFRLAGETPDPAPGPPVDVRPSLLALIQRLPDTAALVLSARYDVLAWNPLAAALLGDFSAVPQRERNVIRQLFLGGASRLGAADRREFGRHAVRQLRTAATRYPSDAGTAALVATLTVGSATFARLWDAHDVDVPRHQRKTVEHPEVGPIALTCDVLDIADRDQQLVLYTAEPGSRDEQALQLLRVIGTQRMDVPS